MVTKQLEQIYSLNHEFHTFAKSIVIHADCFAWMKAAPSDSIHAIVTDPPYGIKEYEPEQLEKRSNGNGGVWRIPPSFDGHSRSPLPRFTALSSKERERIQHYFYEWATLALRVLRPGAHIFLASNVLLSQTVFSAIADAGLEFRGQIIRLVRTLRGGDRPKNAEDEFPDVCSMPRGCYEPWGIFRKPIPEGMTVSECLRCFQTGGLRRKPDGNPFEDVIESERTPHKERAIADHPSLKPQSFLRQIVYASLPLGEGIVLDPFMGSGSTIAAAEAIGYSAIGIEKNREYYSMSLQAIPDLSSRYPVKGIQMSFQLP
ncbi:MAG: methyltransferase [Chloroflexus sp.]|uniref:DNA-methyltransferase n=1 Tax=Chloroflexus sp. TaxID=1904827 RepID=UPI0021DF37E6|nr:DNA methyltransferase [Chloroflexus sp.]GIV89750.1 MAG: methyltransferase [Chloroflexus sp.]